jgi:hypothetical protein
VAYDFAKNYPAIGQIGANTCWAACLSWWLKVMAHGYYSRKWLWQEELIERFRSLTEANGSVSPRQFVEVGKDAEVRMTVRYVTGDTVVDDYTFEMPCLLVFNYPKIGGTHMNVVFNRDYSKGTVQCMEPYFPFPGEDGKRTGQFVTRPLSFFFNSEEVGVGYATPGK